MVPFTLVMSSLIKLVKKSSSVRADGREISRSRSSLSGLPDALEAFVIIITR